MRNTMKWVMLGTTAMWLVAACGTAPKVATRNNQKIKIKADCVAQGPITVDVDNWTPAVDRGGTIDWIQAGGNAKVVIQPKIRKEDDWPFENLLDITPLPGDGAPKKVRLNAGNPGGKSRTYRYVIQITCSGPNPQTVVIDPDIIVN